ncbi:putative hydrolase or acyltransferase of alpha/beta superfamily [Xenococcus sp. PCC 7305]|uniref:alpha/beta fold hydrolase n=1 Tax=Xenococcus sp. PCC 7305 TaxID=102125 RepID=UPI0002AC8F5C|nr:alpha/beta fold hydrolase [Xenococcus sp. PCC 7305]ELS02024.1 putative hydrolase or acyltransferase of alpha/beta superfamily [Xenococcus sp. PCC 7305]
MGQRSWQERIGNQRDWIWRGWQTRYSYFPTQTISLEAKQTPLILIHGFGASIEHWRHNIPVLGQEYPVYALDLLGFGASRKADTEYTVKLWVEQVHDFWEAFIGEPVVLVGNSIGSLVCMNIAAIYPEMVKAIVMLSLPDVSIRQEMIPSAIQPLVTSLENLIASPLLIKILLKILRQPSIISRWAKVAYEDNNAVNDELVQILSAPAYDKDADRTLYNLSQGVRKANFSLGAKQVLPELTIPMLLIWGLQDRMVPSNLASFFAGLNDKIELIELDKMGHCPHDESPELFNKILLEWLSKILIN